jgi:hypothetical protein
MDPVELLLGADGEDNGAALIAALRQQQGQTEEERTALRDSLARQQGQAGRLRTLSLLASVGQNPLLAGLQRAAGEQGGALEGMAARSEQRLASPNGGMNPLGLARLLQTKNRQGQMAEDEDERQKQASERIRQAWARINAAKTTQEDKAEQAASKAESGLRKEVLNSDAGKKYLQSKTAYRSIANFVANPSPSNDMALVFAAMKALDPDSVVKEGEQIQVRNTTNLPGKILNYFNKAKTGQTFGPEQRAEIQDMAKRGLDAQAATLRELSAAYEPIAKAAGADMRRVMPLNLEGGPDINLDAPAPAGQPAPKPAAGEAPKPAKVQYSPSRNRTRELDEKGNVIREYEGKPHG